MSVVMLGRGQWIIKAQLGVKFIPRDQKLSFLQIALPLISSIKPNYTHVCISITYK
jgi:hypothetical protein